MSPSLTVIKKRKNQQINPEKLMKGELSRMFGLDPEDLDIGTEKEAKVLLEEKEEDWAELPVASKVFFNDFIREPMFPIQQTLCDAVLGVDSCVWPTDYEEAFALWGKGSGKDRTSAKMCTYVTYKLMCMRDPHRFLKQGADASLDVANMSKNGRQAKKVYFANLKSIVRRCKNPLTGENWFTEQGVDVREKRDIQSAEINFTGPKNSVSHIRGEITAHSLDSEQNTGEGYTLFFVVLDELGSFTMDGGQALHDALSETILSRFEGLGKLLAISFMYDRYDPMQVLMNQLRKDPKVFVSGPHATWTVNLLRQKKSFARRYAKSPVRSRRVYECKIDAKRSGFIRMRSVIEKVFNNDVGKNPIAGSHQMVGFYPQIQDCPLDLKEVKFSNWFKPKDSCLYTVHIDLAKGKQKGDSIGLCLSHPEKMQCVMDPQVKRLLIQMGMVPPDEEEISKGVVIDLMLAIRGKTPSDEARFASLRDFVYRLKFVMEFNIIYATFDGYESVDSVQQMNERGIETYRLSVDKDNDAYETMSELAYQGLLKAYPHIVADREMEEIDLDPKGKVNHPRISVRRELEEGLDRGSKDVTDCIAATCKTSIEKIPTELGVFLG